MEYFGNHCICQCSYASVYLVLQTIKWDSFVLFILIIYDDTWFMSIVLIICSSKSDVESVTYYVTKY